MVNFDASWAAGFYDGEGSSFASLSTSRPGKYYPQMSISQAGEDGLQVLQRFQKAVDGLGKIRGPYSRKNNKPIYQWTVASKDGINLVGNILFPFLSEPKKKQLIKALEQ